ncbi:hypothetical protein N8D74_04620 [Curtobacterium flaccumfaciens]|uniref:Uncharacterized protein n=1 Tax=Curtobacterium poinsettiae TaxID=159612 RepID=A0A9Q9P8E5_9MICO|nr:hypothetical protein [Curtobacterium flaccumfaciens]UXN26172.1 hypothetical protein N8D74_04620 [Curtobacterium flaccumfaciens]UYC81014.1 hypothetical protein OE229_00700 [Curtobacterium flaccumfaciens pv. poinsettiae]
MGVVGTYRPAQKGPARVFLERLQAIGLLFLIIGIPVGTFGFGPSILASYDDGHRMKVVCRVDSAEANMSSSRSAKGAGGAQPQVTFHTNCGNLLYLEGVDRSSMQRIASAVELGERYRFTVGAGSFKLRSGLKILKVAPEIYSYAAVAASEVPRRGSRDSPKDE